MDSASKKIKVAVSHLLRTQMELDIEDYGLKGIGNLCNRILARYTEFPQPDLARFAGDDALYKTVAPLQFTLNRPSESFANYARSLAGAANIKTAALCRYYFECYVNLPRAQRECFIFRESLDKLMRAVKARVNVNLTYRGEPKRVSPCFLAFSPSQVRAYVVVCDDRTDAPAASRFHSLRLCHIRGVAPERGAAFHCENFELSHQAETFREHFDPFLCYGQQVKVRLTEQGAERYNRLTTNRPKVIVVDGAPSVSAAVDGAGDYTFECSEKLAKVYFPQFLFDAEILAPRELRLWFKDQFEKAGKVYGG